MFGLSKRPNLLHHVLIKIKLKTKSPKESQTMKNFAANVKTFKKFFYLIENQTLNVTQQLNY